VDGNNDPKSHSARSISQVTMNNISQAFNRRRTGAYVSGNRHVMQNVASFGWLQYQPIADKKRKKYSHAALNWTAMQTHVDLIMLPRSLNTMGQ
jgi:hypothetical protein